MTDLFEASVAVAGRDLERAAARDGSRGIGIATRRNGGLRELVSVVGSPVGRSALEEHPGWDVPLAAVLEIETSSGPRTFVAELLRVGVPSTWLDDIPPASRPASVPSFATELVRRVAVEHARGGVVGRLHPATMLVDPGTRTLVAIAQRPLRIADVIAVEGDRPLLGYRTWTPNDLDGRPRDMPDDVFRLGLLLWHWRHGEHPLGAATDGALLGSLTRLAAGGAVPTPPPADDLDRLLLACLAPRPEARPTSSEILAALTTGRSDDLRT